MGDEIWIYYAGSNSDHNESIVACAKCVLLIGGESPGLKWEMVFLREHISHACVFVIILPGESVDQTSDWKLQRSVFATAGMRLPEAFPGSGSVLAFEQEWNAYPIITGCKRAHVMTSALKEHSISPKSPAYASKDLQNSSRKFRASQTHQISGVAIRRKGLFQKPHFG